MSSVVIKNATFPTCCQNCWYTKCNMFGIEWAQISGEKTYRNSKDKTCPLETVEEFLKDRTFSSDDEMSKIKKFEKIEQMYSDYLEDCNAQKLVDKISEIM